MTVKKSLINVRPNLFTTPFVRQAMGSTRQSYSGDSQGLKDSNISSTSSFRYDAPGSGFKSTQQLPIDYSRFENHTFFNSAMVNVNVAFDRVINEYPFDGTKKATQAFLDSLTGFEHYVFKNFPKNKGYLIFSGATGPSPSGSHIVVEDFAGSTFPTLSSNDTGDNILDPGTKSFSVEMQLFLPAITNQNQIVCQKLSGSSQGFTIAVENSLSTSTANLMFGVTSASFFVSASMPIPKGQFNHVCLTYNRQTGIDKLFLYRDGSLITTSSHSSGISNIIFALAPMIIGSGSAQSSISGSSSGPVDFTPAQTLSGAIDEFRVFHNIRTEEQQKLYAQKNIFPSEDLKLYYKFNEPSGTLGPTATVNATVLDSSGNSLHSVISNYSSSLRLTSSTEAVLGISPKNPMLYENSNFNPVLFPSFYKVVRLNQDLLASGSTYDSQNPNLITRLVPDHYFLEGKAYDALETETGTITSPYTGSSNPGSGKLGSSQLLSTLLYVYAKSFDETKIFLDHFSNILNVEYENKGSVADSLLPFVAEHYGFVLPALFGQTDIDQFIDGENITVNISKSAHSLQHVQNQVWRRILVNMRHLIQSKGTVHAIKSLIRLVGIDPDSNFRIREYGGPSKLKLADLRENRTQISALIDFSGSSAPVTTTTSSQGIPDNLPFIQSTYLSASRLEVGWPYPSTAGSPTPEFVQKKLFPPHGIWDRPGDGLLTSGSFTVEAIYSFPKNSTGSLYMQSQSLMRMHVTGTNSLGPATHGVVTNLFAISGSSQTTTSSLEFVARPASTSVFVPQQVLRLVLTGVNIFDGNQWNIAYGRYRHDDPDAPLVGTVQPILSSTYFLRCARQSFGKIVDIYTTSSIFLSHQDGTYPGLTTFDFGGPGISTVNSSGSFLVVGSQSLNTNFGATNAGRFLLNTQSIDDYARITNFQGRVGHIRFWSQALNDTEWKEHVRNFKSLGVRYPRKNFNFTVTPTGSFEKLRLDVTTDQIITSSNAAGNILLVDFSQNNLYFTGSGFQKSTQVIKPERFDFSIISPKIDDAASSNKVRVRSYLDPANLAEDPYAATAPVHFIPAGQGANDDARFSIDFSVVDALDQDMINIFSTLEELDSLIGNPELFFSPDYPGLEDLREIYFNRLTDKINLKSFFEFFKFFDTAMSEFISTLLPRKTRFLGINFVVESHMLERSKIEYMFSDNYLTDAFRPHNPRPDLNDILKRY